jgi:serine/threonine protein kinase
MRFLGKGSFGSVFAAMKTPKSDHAPSALKIFDTQDEEARASFKNECKVLRNIKAATEAEGWQKYADYFPCLERASKPDNHPLYIITTQVYFYFCDKRPFLIKHTRQLLLALQFLHSNCKICHGDISPKHLMFNIYGELVLIDFGSASIGCDARPISGTLITMSQAQLEAYSSAMPAFTPKPSDDLESAFKSVKMMTDQFLERFVCETREAKAMFQLWNKRFCKELKQCHKTSAYAYEGVLEVLTRDYIPAGVKLEMNPSPPQAVVIEGPPSMTTRSQRSAHSQEGQPLTKKAKKPKKSKKSPQRSVLRKQPRSRK